MVCKDKIERDVKKNKVYKTARDNRKYIFYSFSIGPVMVINCKEIDRLFCLIVKHIFIGIIERDANG